MGSNTSYNPLVSVIIPVYDGAKTITNTIKSVQRQTMSDWEVLVIDNGSTDQTESIVENISKNDNRVKLLKASKGRSLARNKGLDFAHGKYINFLDADDQLTPQHLERGVLFLNNNDVFFAYVEGTEYVDDRLKKTTVRNDVHVKSLDNGNPFGISSVLFRKTSNLIKFVPGLEHNEDWLFWYQNLIGKKIQVRGDLIGDRILITGNNTMLDVYNMLGSEIIVLSKMESNIRLLKKLKLMVMFFRSKYKNEKKFIDMVRQKFRYTYIFVKAVSNLPIVHQLIEYIVSYKISLMNKSSVYRNESNVGRIYLAGYFRENLGDDLFVKTIANRYPDSQITILVEKNFISPYLDIPNVKAIEYTFYKRLFSKFVSIIGIKNFTERKLVSQNDLIIEIGGSIFQQITNETVTSRRLSYLKSKKPIFIVGSNFGPYRSEKYYEAYKDYFSKVNGVVFRDKKSYSLFRELDTISIAPDVVFGLPVVNSKSKIVQDRKKLAILSIINIQDKMSVKNVDSIQKAYDEKIRELIVQLVERDYTIMLFGFSKAENDGLAAERILNSIPSHIKDSVIVRSHESINESLAWIQKGDILFSSRFHAMILGWKLQIPQYVFSYSQKTDNVINDLFPAQAHIDVREMDKIDAETLINSVNTMDVKTLKKVETLAEGQFQFIDQFFESNSLKN